MSDKQRERNTEWLRIKFRRCALLAEKHGFTPCEYCGAPGTLYSGRHEDLNGFDNHHIDGNRANNTAENAYICHRKCHGFITDNNLEVRQEGFEGKINSVKTPEVS
jgi:hypothetical protein